MSAAIKELTSTRGLIVLGVKLGLAYGVPYYMGDGVPPAAAVALIVGGEHVPNRAVRGFMNGDLMSTRKKRDGALIFGSFAGLSVGSFVGMPGYEKLVRGDDLLGISAVTALGLTIVTFITDTALDNFGFK